jgi:hypothetical protein
MEPCETACPLRGSITGAANTAGGGGGRGRRRAITGQLRSVDVHKRETYKKFCQERPGQLYDVQERPGGVRGAAGPQDRNSEGEEGGQPSRGGGGVGEEGGVHPVDGRRRRRVRWWWWWRRRRRGGRGGRSISSRRERSHSIYR